jgi:DNA repair protein RecN (Recombination protein N)
VLVELHVAGLGVIDECRLSFHEGLTVLTGETGAGKTLVVDALDLLLGGRARRGLVPAGRSALLEAVFTDEHGDEVILARELPAEGRARAWIDGRMASVPALAERAVGLCDIYGQHEHHSLLAGGSVRRALDAFGGLDTETLRGARAQLRALLAEQSELGGDATTIERERALLEHQIAEIEAARLVEADEIERLFETVKLLESATTLRREIEHGLEVLDQDADGPRQVIAGLAKSLSGYQELDEVQRSLVEGEVLLGELTSELRRVAERVEEDPQRLEEANTRLTLLSALCRRYGPTLGDVLERHWTMAVELDALRAGQARRDVIDQHVARVTSLVAELERALEAQRTALAPQFAEAISARLATLALERAVVRVTVAGPAGDHVELLFSANPGLEPQPVAKVASGGELARLMLALRLTMPGGPMTMVFDEVDAGIGGATALTLASALGEVAEERQVLVVTHLAQVAALADHHLGVVKSSDDEATSAVISVLDGEARVEEIARMLSGQPDSSSARRHASELLGR